MVRKTFYLTQDQNRKLRVLAAMRGCTEAEVIRDALDRLLDPEMSVAQLPGAGSMATGDRDRWHDAQASPLSDRRRGPRLGGTGDQP